MHCENTLKIALGLRKFVRRGDLMSTRVACEKADAVDGRLTYTAVLRGSVNGAKLEIVGDGTISEDEGVTRGDYELHLLPADFEPGYLTSVLITGYPNASRSADGAVNPFKGLSYSYQREIRFSTGQTVTFTAECIRSEHHLSSRFDLEGDFPSERVTEQQPIRESWKSLPEAGLVGFFEVAWGSVRGEVVRATARSLYRLPPGVSDRIALYRSIAIQCRIHDRRMRLDQVSDTRSRPTSPDAVDSLRVRAL